MVPLYRKARDGAQQIGFSPWPDKMLDRLVDEQARLLPRALLAEQRHECRLARVGVLAGALARRGLVAARSIRSSAIWKASPMLRA